MHDLIDALDEEQGKDQNKVKGATERGEAEKEDVSERSATSTPTKSLPSPQSTPLPASPPPPPSKALALSPLSDSVHGQLPASKLLELIEARDPALVGIVSVVSEVLREMDEFLDELEEQHTSAPVSKQAIRERLYKIIKTLNLRGAVRPLLLPLQD